jgi:hypothetical protein
MQWACSPKPSLLVRCLYIRVCADGVLRVIQISSRLRSQWHRSRLLSMAFSGTARAARCGRRTRLFSAESSPIRPQSGRRPHRTGTLPIVKKAVAMVEQKCRSWGSMTGSFLLVGRVAGRWSDRTRMSWGGRVWVRQGGDGVCDLEILRGSVLNDCRAREERVGREADWVVDVCRGIL